MYATEPYRAAILWGSINMFEYWFVEMLVYTENLINLVKEALEDFI